MTHEELRDELSESRDGELSAPRREALARHLEDCASCRAELSDWERLAHAFLRRPAPPAPAETERFVRLLMARLPAPAPEKVPFWAFLAAGWLTPAFGLASAALALSFLPYGARSYAAIPVAAAPVFIADGQGVSLAAVAPVPADGVGAAVGLDEEAR